MNTLAILSGTHPIEKVTGERYIRRIFKKFQTEFIASNNCIHETLRKDNGNGCCRVGRVEEERRKQKVVHFAAYNAVQVRCSCSMFETMGFLCQHSLYILKRKQVLEFPEHYYGWMDIGCQVSHRGWRLPQFQDGCKNGNPISLGVVGSKGESKPGYEDTKDGCNDASLLGEFYDQFSKRVSLRKGTEAHPSRCVGSIDFVL